MPPFAEQDGPPTLGGSRRATGMRLRLSCHWRAGLLLAAVLCPLALAAAGKAKQKPKPRHWD